MELMELLDQRAIRDMLAEALDAAPDMDVEWADFEPDYAELDFA